jgi:hypothetical protein
MGVYVRRAVVEEHKGWLMFLHSLAWTGSISRYVSQRSDLAEEHKDPPYVPHLVDAYKLCKSAFNLRNIF